MNFRKPTFAFIAAALFAAQLFAANPWLAEKEGLSIEKADLPPCTATSPAQNRAFTVRNCVTKISCATTGTETVRLVCDGTEYRAINATATAVDLGDYVLITRAGAQSITATGATNDITLSTSASGDDIIAAAGDAFTVTTGGAAAITTTAGAITLTAGGTTEDASVISTDDIFLTPDDALTAVAGGAVTLTATSGTMALASSAGAITVTAVGAGNDITATTPDDFIVAAADIVAGATTTIAFDAGGGTDELGIATDSVSVSTGIAFRIVGGAAPPVACAAGTAGTIYYDTTINKFCVCNATAYVLMNDDSTTTGCS